MRSLACIAISFTMVVSTVAVAMWGQGGVTLAPGAAVPIAVALSPTSVTLADNTPAGTLISTATVTMSDNSIFRGILTTSNTDLYAISGMNIVAARNFVAADDGARPTTITAVPTP